LHEIGLVYLNLVHPMGAQGGAWVADL